MARVRLEYRHKDHRGNTVVNTKATLYEPGTDDEITAYAASSGGSALTQPIEADEHGYIVAWLDTPQDVELVVTDDTDWRLHEVDDRPFIPEGDLEGNDPTATFVALATDQNVTGRKTYVGGSRGEGAGNYRLEMGGTFPNIAMNTSLTINGETGTPVPIAVAGEEAYMLGISTDIDDAPSLVIRGLTGPVIRTYAGDSSLRMDLTASGQMRLWSGAVTLPAYSFLDDENTGMDHPAPGVVNFAADGVERGRFSSVGLDVTGRVWATAPAAEIALKVIGNAATAQPLMEVGKSGSPLALYVAASGQVAMQANARLASGSSLAWSDSDADYDTRIAGVRGVSLAFICAGEVMKIAPSAWGLHGAAITKPTVTGSRSGNAALASLLTALASYNLITDSSSA